MAGNVMIDRSIDGSGSQAVRHGKKKQHPVLRTEGESEQSQNGQSDGHNTDPLRVNPADHARTEQGRNYGHEGDGHRYKSRIG